MRKNWIVGIYGQELNLTTANFIKNHQPHGIILFDQKRNNIISVKQLKKLTRDILDLGTDSYKPIIFIDQEGGAVQRIMPPIASKHYSAANTFGEMYEKTPVQAVIATYNNYYHLTKELVDEYGICGILAPVADLMINVQTDIINTRAFSRKPKIVVDLSIAALHGIKDAGGLTCIKHVPGHGRAMVDSHLCLPIVDTDLTTLMATDFKIFKDIMHLASNLVDYAMTAHIVFTAIDTINPITTSKIGINFLREHLGVTCKIMSDDIYMEALSGTTEERLTRVFDSGCDLALVCHCENLNNLFSEVH